MSHFLFLSDKLCQLMFVQYIYIDTAKYIMVKYLFLKFAKSCAIIVLAENNEVIECLILVI